MLIYLDESGDLGWSFNSPYRQGGSSRYLTIASLIVTPQQKARPKRLVKRLYQKHKWPTSVEKKWADMTLVERQDFAEKAASLIARYPNDIRYLSITVRKQNVQNHIRKDANKLYNYMISLSLLNEMAKHPQVTFIPDPRSIKVQSGNSLHDYLQTQLWFEEKAKTQLSTIPCDSSTALNIQFADMLAGVVQGHFEDEYAKPWDRIGHCISYKTLFS